MKVRKGRGFAKEIPGEREMTLGADGCHRCGGWVIEGMDFIFSENGIQPCFRCLICGARRYLAYVSPQERQAARKRARKPGKKARRMQPVYAYTSVGKRLVRCGCNDTFDAHDDGTACFEEGARSAQCRSCGYYPWYRIEAVAGGSRRPGDERGSSQGG